MENRVNSHVEIIWGVRLLDDGFTAIPNLIIRNYRKLGIEHGEWGLICQLLTYKHDERDPFPSRKELAENLCCSERQIDKWVKSLREKKLIRTGTRRNSHNKQFAGTVYSLKPLLDACLGLVGEPALPPSADEFEIIWDDEKEPCELQVRTEPCEPQVRVPCEPQVRTKIKRENNNSFVCLGAPAEIAVASESVPDSESGPDPIYEALIEHVPKYCYVDGMPLGEGYITEIYLMLIEQFPNQLDPEVVRMASELYFERACKIENGQVVMKLKIDTPVGYFKFCYDGAIKSYKAKQRQRSKRKSLARA